MPVWFTSDTHFGHANIIRYCGRPFSSAAEMDAAMILRWNTRVLPTDTVYHLGDVGFWKPQRCIDVVEQLNGHKVLIRGNHDRKTPDRVFLRAGFAEVHAFGKLVQLQIEDHVVEMQHVPHYGPPFGEQPDGITRLCGHVHEKWRHQRGTINVGVDQWGFEPVTLEELETAWRTSFARNLAPR
jgi:calcineurin-like phosphoesterase family protein